MDGDRDAGGLLPKAHQLPLVAGAQRMPGAAEVERLQQVGLAGAVGPMQDGQTLPKVRLGAGICAEITQ